MKHKLVRFSFAFLILSLLLTAPRAQPTAPSSDDRIALYQALLDLANPWTVMCVAAHPDDEDGTSLIVMRHKFGAHTVSLFSTFGEGGQNAIGPELYEELGAIRARETMAAAEIQGSEPHFLGLKDFGYSKTRDEAFKFWGHEEALRRMVLEIRKLRPDVIITNHSTTSNDHGQHQATALMVVEAFDAAADPKQFPEQLKDGVTTWQVQRLFVRARGNQPLADNPSIVTIDPNERDPVRGTMFAEQALAALQKHATQGPWPKSFAEFVARFRAFSGQSGATGQMPLIRYRLARFAKDSELTTTPPAFDMGKESHNFLDGLTLPQAFMKDADVPLINGKPLVQFADDRAQVTQALIHRAAKDYRFPSADSDFQRLQLVQTRIQRAIALAAGIDLHVTPASLTVTPDSNVDIKVRITNNGGQTLYGVDCGSDIASAAKPLDASQRPGGPTSILTTWTELKAGNELTKHQTIKIPPSTQMNTPLATHLYEPSALGLKLVTHCSASLRPGQMNAVNLSATTLLNVAPPVEITNISPSIVVVTPQTQKTPRGLTAYVSNHRKLSVHTSIEAVIAADKPEVKRNKVNETPLTLGPEEKRELKITLPLNLRTEARTVVRHYTLVPGQPQPVMQDPPLVKPHLKFLLQTNDRSSNEVSVPLVYADASVAPNLRVAYIRGFDFSLPEALNALGVESKELRFDEVKTADLSKFTSVIVDNRVYESKPELIAMNQKLLDYANGGGTLIAFYHKSDEWNPDPRRNRPQLAPYKLILGNERITDENAPVTFLEPEHPLLNVPNKLNQDDFKDWIQERGLYYPREWDPQFHALLQSNDPAEAPLKGGLLVADYGRGHYIYSSMVWYRQLRAGVPGAYRMLANMISYGRGK